ncbi:hypothetical protein [Phosphitispora fastidiosa]|uniref:hypothetical protein n=1 Tax=Phosphitispora fastidiosa TaxID=2837202 RepID=UPI001E2AAFEB|nr:hypothetical protein [Phosphitispora fastidiosa]MBU7005978.1 hypothetical protein [Phosphitispora fastidiosa]
MMSLTETNLIEVTKRQYFYKLRGYMSMFLNMVGVQIVALLFSSGGVSGSSGMSSNNIQFSVNWFSADMVISFTLMWAFVVAIYLTTNDYRNIDFGFVSNRLSSNISNIAFLLTAGVAGGITASLAGYLIRVIVYLSTGSQNIVSENFLILPQELLAGTIAAALYIILVSSLGYFVGVLAQLHKIFVVLLPALIFGAMIAETRIAGKPQTFVKLTEFFTNEGSFTLFALKVMITVVVLFWGGIIMSNRLEVRQ